MDRGKGMGTLGLAAMGVILITSLSNAPAAADFGSEATVLLLLVGALMVAPTILVTAELTSAHPSESGVEHWVTLAFGPRFGFAAMWFQWLTHVCAVIPTVLFIAATAAHVADPPLAASANYLTLVTLAVVWMSVLLNSLGVRDTVWISAASVLVGTILATAVLALLVLVGVIRGIEHVPAFETSAALNDVLDLKALSGVTLLFMGLVGLEVTANFVDDVRRPHRSYRRGLMLAGGVSIAVSIVAALAIATALGSDVPNLVTGVPDAYAAAADALDLDWVVPIAAFVIAVASIVQVVAFLQGPAIGLHAVLVRRGMHRRLTPLSKRGTPMRVVVIEAVIATGLALGVMLAPSGEVAFDIVVTAIVQMYMLTYLLMFLAALRLAASRAEPAPAAVPGGKWGLRGAVTTGSLSAVLVFVLAFIPPDSANFARRTTAIGVFLVAVIASAIFAPGADRRTAVEEA